MLTKDELLVLLKTNDKAVARALVVLNNRQTADEQATQGTRYLNGMGFRPCHARMGTSMATFFQRNGYLSPKQIAYWRATDKSGSMRIGLYWRQILEEAEAKERTKIVEVAAAAGYTIIQAAKGNAIDIGGLPGGHVETRDLGNDMERKMHLEYELGDVMDSDDPALINPIKNEIDEIDAYWKKIRPNG
jgi:hypothetical protein